MSPPARLGLGQAVALGALHGPAELLPISSSGHVALVPWLLGWDYQELAPEVRKAFEVGLHAGTALGLLVALRDDVAVAAREASPRLALLIALSFAPPAATGWAMERQIEQRLGTPGSIAAGLILGGILLGWADRRPQLRGEGSAGVCDALWLGAAQACALMPGISRGGATLTAARARAFTRGESARLSSHVALPIIGAATALKLVRLRRSGLPPGLRLPLAAGAAASLASTVAVAPSITRAARANRSLLPFAAYRIALGTWVLRRLSRGRSGP